MAELFDKNPIPYERSEDIYVKEEYVGYGRNDLKKMTKSELKDELKRIGNEIKKIEDEFDAANKEIPTFSLKEQYKTAFWYKEKIEKELADREDESKTTENAIDDMILDLDRKLKQGLITEEYHDKYVNKLTIRKEELLMEESTKEDTSNKKKHPIRKFRDKLTDYRNKRNK